jgi:hypothetical protein
MGAAFWQSPEPMMSSWMLLQRGKFKSYWSQKSAHQILGYLTEDAHLETKRSDKVELDNSRSI